MRLISCHFHFFPDGEMRYDLLHTSASCSGPASAGNPLVIHQTPVYPHLGVSSSHVRHSSCPALSSSSISLGVPSKSLTTPQFPMTVTPGSSSGPPPVPTPPVTRQHSGGSELPEISEEPSYENTILTPGKPIISILYSYPQSISTISKYQHLLTI